MVAGITIWRDNLQETDEQERGANETITISPYRRMRSWAHGNYRIISTMPRRCGCRQIVREYLPPPQAGDAMTATPGACLKNETGRAVSMTATAATDAATSDRI